MLPKLHAVLPRLGDREYLIDMRELFAHTWEVTHSNVAELLPNRHLFTHNCGHWLEELTSDNKTVWRWRGNGDLVAPNHHDFWFGGDIVVSLAAKREPVARRIYQPGTEPGSMRTDVILKINRNKEILWYFSFSEHVEEPCA